MFLGVRELFFRHSLNHATQAGDVEGAPFLQDERKHLVERLDFEDAVVVVIEQVRNLPKLLIFPHAILCNQSLRAESPGVRRAQSTRTLLPSAHAMGLPCQREADPAKGGMQEQVGRQWHWETGPHPEDHGQFFRRNEPVFVVINFDDANVVRLRALVLGLSDVDFHFLNQLLQLLAKDAGPSRGLHR